MKRSGLYGLKTADIIIAVLILGLSISPLFSFNRNKAGAADKVNVYTGNKQVKQLALGQDTIYKLNNMSIEVKAGRVRIAGSDCPRKVCVHTGWISGLAQTIVCVPNKVLVEIPGGGAGQYNAVSY